MDCRVARDRMHELLNRTLADSAALEVHLADCEACRAHLTRLRHLDGALRASMSAPLDEAALDRAAAAALRQIQDEPASAAPRASAWAPVVAAAGLILAFLLGTVAGRAAWPRERVVTRLVEKRVPVEVMREREVIREVPVVRTRVVYRDRVVRVPAPSTSAVGPGEQGSAQRGPVKLEETVLRLSVAFDQAPAPLVTEELHTALPVRPAPASTDEQESPADGEAGSLRQPT